MARCEVLRNPSPGLVRGQCLTGLCWQETLRPCCVKPSSGICSGTGSRSGFTEALELDSIAGIDQNQLWSSMEFPFLVKKPKQRFRLFFCLFFES